MEGLRIRPAIKENYEGKTFRAIGSEMCWTEKGETDHEFYIHYFRDKIGNDWWISQSKLHPHKRHIIYDWFELWGSFTEKYAKAENEVEGGWASILTGGAQSLLSLAYDHYCLRHTSSLPEKLFERLKNKNEFQGARYEMAIAALFVKQDYEIEFIDNKSTKHWEFTAIHPHNDERMAIEVKSRHRSGVLKYNGTESSLERIKIGISRLLPEAVSQGPVNIPFVIFIDLNLPLTKDVNYPDRIWWSDLQEALDRFGIGTSENPDPFTAIIITNFSYHYSADIQIDTGKYSQDGGSLIAKYPTTSFRNINTIGSLMTGIRHMPDVPNDS